MSRTGASRAVDRSRLRLLLASGSVAAPLIAGGAPPTWALGKTTPHPSQSSCTVIQNGGTVGSVSNSSPTGNCILVENNANVTGNVTNTSADLLTANGSESALAKFDSEFAAGSQTYAGSGTLRYTW